MKTDGLIYIYRERARESNNEIRYYNDWLLGKHSLMCVHVCVYPCAESSLHSNSHYRKTCVCVTWFEDDNRLA